MPRTAAVLLSCSTVLIGVAGCGGNSSPATSPCEAPTPPPTPGTMTLCLGGALTGTLSQVDPSSTQCSALEPDSFRGSFYAPLNGVVTQWEFSDGKGPGTFDLNAESAAITLNVSQSSTERNWSSVNPDGRSGTITFDPDRAGTVDVTLPQRDYDTGGEVPGALVLTVRGTFRCPTEVT